MQTISDQTLYQILEATHSIELAGNLEQMLRQTIEEALQIVPGDAVAIAMIEPARKWLRTMATGPAREALEGYHLYLNGKKGLIEKVLLTGQTVVLNNCDDEETGEMYRKAHFACGVGLPLRRQGQLSGVIAVLRQKPNGTDLTPLEILTLEVFARQVGPILAATQKITELETALKSRDEFLSIASHDLRNPLTALRGFSQITSRVIERVPEGQPVPRQQLLTNLQRIVKQSNSLDKLIGKLLDVSRINTGRLEIRPELLELSELINEAAERCAVAVMTTESENQIDPALCHQMLIDVGEEKLWGMFDRERIGQMVTNLLDNAVKYSPAGGPVTIKLRRINATTAELSVRDHGIGISEENQLMIFNRWSRIYSSREGEVAEVNGLGLGLFICREIVRKHGGQINVESEPGEGSNFLVTLPISDY